MALEERKSRNRRKKTDAPVEVDPTPAPIEEEPDYKAPGWEKLPPPEDPTKARVYESPVSSPSPIPSPITPATVASFPIGLPANALDGMQHGLTLPQFDSNSWLAQDLFANSSPLKETDKETADQMLDSIEKKRQTIKVATANINLNTDVVKAGTAQQKFIGAVIDYGTAQVNSATKYVNYQIAGVQYQIADTKLQQTQEQLTQAQITLEGTKALSPLIREEWEQKKALKSSQIQALKQKAFEAAADLNAEAASLAGHSN